MKHNHISIYFTFAFGCLAPGVYNVVVYVVAMTTGDNSGKVVIWNMAPVVEERDEKDKATPKLLCQMDNHLGA